MTTKNESACIYAAIILIDDDIAVTGEKIQTLLKAANVEVEPYWPGLFSKALESINPKDLITNLSSGVGSAPAGGGGAAAASAAPAPAAETKAEEKKKEEEEESDDDMGFGLFD